VQALLHVVGRQIDEESRQRPGALLCLRIGHESTAIIGVLAGGPAGRPVTAF